MNPGFDEATKKEYIKILTDELKVLRAKAGVTQQELADKLGVSRQTYGMIENRTYEMAWSQFLALVFLFRSNDGTAKILEWVGVYTSELEQYLKLTGEYITQPNDVKTNENRPAARPMAAAARMAPAARKSPLPEDDE